MKTFIKTSVIALFFMLITPLYSFAQEYSGTFYVTPKLLYSFKTGDMHPANITKGIFTANIMGEKGKDDGFGFGLAWGYKFGSVYNMPIRLEGEYIYHGKASFNQQAAHYIDSNYGTAKEAFNVKAHSLMANAFVDIPLGAPMTPYLGGGIGLAQLKTDYTLSSTISGIDASLASSKNSTNFAWNVGGGVILDLSESTSLDFGYRYMDLGKAETGSFGIDNFRTSSELDYTAHEFSLGLRFNLN